MNDKTLAAVLTFWFEELSPKNWYVCDPDIDAVIKDRFAALYDELSASLQGVFDKPADTLAGIIVLDQFPRNMFRDTAKAFASDAQALNLSKAGIVAGQDEGLVSTQKAFFYMPFMHSENADDQARSVELFGAHGLENNYDFAVSHKVIIDRFGRYPHRNTTLGRNSTDAELQFLTEPGSSF